MSALSERPADPVVGRAVPHESAALHVTGEALYTDDLVERTKDVLHAWPVQAPHAHARVTALRTEPAYAVPPVFASPVAYRPTATFTSSLGMPCPQHPAVRGAPLPG